MAPSQLKQLKQSLRDNGLIGPTRSKKGAKGQHNKTRRDDIDKAAALAEIRDKSRPFDVQVSARPKKFQVTTTKTMREQGKAKPAVLGRPGVSRSKGEELRRKTLLVDLQSRGKVGGILDRRIGENDTRLTHEERLHQRLIREASTKRRGPSLFDLENDENEFALTHGGQEIDFAGLGSDNEDDDDVELSRKRPLDELDESDDEPGNQKPERKKTKAEVMQEVIAKSKFHRQERKMAHEEDLLVLAELDKQIPDILKELRGIKAPEPAPISARPTVTIPPPRPSATGANSIPVGGAAAAAAAVAEEAPVLSQQAKDKAYDIAVKELASDSKARPTLRTKTKEEIAKEYDDRMKKMEEDRLKRMNGEILPADDIDDDDDDDDANAMDVDVDDDDNRDGDAGAFGFRPSKLGVRLEEEEDDFLLDGDIIASDEDFDLDDDNEDSSGSEDDDADGDDNDDASFTAGFEDDTLDTYVPTGRADGGNDESTTIPCPVTHEELLDLLDGSDIAHLPKTVQQIRGIFGGTLPQHREKLGKFAGVLIQHIHHIGSQQPPPPPAVVDALIRHVQSLSRTFSLPIAVACRSVLDGMVKSDDLTPGDLLFLTVVGTVFSTSDLFHPVALPALTVMTRWLSLHKPTTDAKTSATGCFVVQLAMRYQAKSKRFIPECVNFAIAAIEADNHSAVMTDRFVTSLVRMAELWAETAALVEILSPAVAVCQNRLAKLQSKSKNDGDDDAIKSSIATTKSTLTRLRVATANAKSSRRPLELHHHRPRPIRSLIPRFEDNFDPDKHYDPDRARADNAKLKKEYKRERKGAIRDLRKDANFLARQQLETKKVADRAYHDKMRRLVAEVQTEEGYEKNAYERERKMRKMRR